MMTIADDIDNINAGNLQNKDDDLADFLKVILTLFF